MADGHLQIVNNAPASGRRRGGVLPPPLRMLRDRAERHFATRLKGVFEQVDDTFFDLADRADNYRQQTHFFDAMRLIRFERKAIESAFQQSVGLAFDSLVDEAASERRAVSLLGGNAFELADGEDLEEIIALDTMVSRADESNRQELQFLAMRLEALTSQVVALKDNPLGPDVICDSFFRATQGLDIGIRSKLVLLKLFERHVITSLNDFLQQSNQLLHELGVLPDLESRQGAPAQPIRGKKQRAPSRHPGDFLDRDTALPQQKSYGRLVTQLSSVMSRQWQQPETESTTAKLTPHLPEAAPGEVIKTLKTLQGEHYSSLMEPLVNRLAECQEPLSLGNTERGLIQLVDALFEQMSSDPSFPPLLLPELRNLQIAIAKAALSDAGFFDKPRHPARRLFNETMHAALGFSEDEDTSDDPIYPHIQQTLQQLQQFACSPTRLTQLLTELVATTEKQRRRTTAREQHLLEDEQASSQLDYSYTVVKNLLDDQLVGMELPKVVVTFAEQAWSKVLFLSHLRDGEGSLAWKSAHQVLDQVIDLSLLGSEFSLQIATEFLDTIRMKLAEIALDPYQTEHLIRDLEQLMKAEVTGSVENIELVCVEEVYPSIPGEQRTLVNEPEPDDSIEENYLHDIESISNGSWVEFKRPGGKLRARFIGTAGPLNKLIFVDRQGMKVAEGDRQHIALELKRGNLALLENTPLFDRALAAVIENMRSGQ